ncbi:J domain-containing protein [Rahnella perminowiae]|uniref:J domain-containing protein n=1 Tax=Rahnella perminowiae TaxID=2816244 RepID=UPI00215C00E9|nr:J domain-containing protein [Rahnella perminowiae]MCR9003706.1 J domain-containing protein [Rahnella perminowiae]
MSGQGIWSVLGIEPTQDLGVIKRAYARKLKNTRPDSDPQGYQRLREAFEAAKRQGYDDILSDVVTTAKPL